MDEPTKEAIEEATPLLLEHAVECFDGMVMSVVGLAHIIAHVRKKARDDAAQKCHEIMMQQRAIAGDFDEWEHGKADGAKMCRDALKDQGDKQ